MASMTQLPLTRVKNIIKSDPDITLAGQEAVLLIAKVRSLYRTARASKNSFITVLANCCGHGFEISKINRAKAAHRS